jgi:hypothetical protein
MIFRIMPVQKNATLAARARFSQRGRQSEMGGTGRAVEISLPVTLTNLAITMNSDDLKAAA